MKKRKLLALFFALLCPLCLIHSIVQSSFRDITTFFRGFLKDPKSVGALFPCSSFVGQEITKYLVAAIKKNPNQSIRILEIGAGTGNLTSLIANIIRPGDHLDLVEISPEFCSILCEKFGSSSNISVHCISITDWYPYHSYDFIISTLPFNAFDNSLTLAIVDRIKKLIKSDGIFSYVAYIGFAQLKEPFMRENAKKDHKEKMSALKKLREQYQIDSSTILANMPPVRVYHLQINSKKRS